METRSINDYYVIKYKDEDRLYLPVSEWMNSKDITVVASHHQTGEQDFEKLKDKVKRIKNGNNLVIFTKTT